MTKREQREGWVLSFGIVSLIGFLMVGLPLVSGMRDLLDKIGIVVVWVGFTVLSYMLWMENEP